MDTYSAEQVRNLGTQALDSVATCVDFIACFASSVRNGFHLLQTQTLD